MVEVNRQSSFEIWVTLIPNYTYSRNCNSDKDASGVHVPCFSIYKWEPCSGMSAWKSCSVSKPDVIIVIHESARMVRPLPIFTFHISECKNIIFEI